MSKYPLHDKLKQHRAECDTVGSFLEFLSEQGLCISKLSEHDNKYYPYPMSTSNLIGRFIGIDPIELEKEKKQMIDAFIKK